MAQYDDSVRAGTKAAHALAALIAGDLDPDTTGISWWTELMNAEARGWLSHYLVGTARAVATNLQDAAFHLDRYQDAVNRENIFYARRVRAVRGFPDMRTRNSLDALRSASIEADLVGFFRAAGSVLDTLAAVVIGTAALNINIVTASWATLNTDDHADSYPRTSGPKASKLRRALADPATEGGAQQDQLLKAVRAAMKAAGPPGWDSWTLAMRNSLVHRARWTSFYIQADPRKPEAGLFRPLPRQPELAEGHEIQSKNRLFDVMLSEDAATTMTGTIASIVPVVQAVTEACSRLWKLRRRRTSLLDQPCGDWMPRPAPAFPGYAPNSIGHALSKATVMVVAAQDGPRFAALKTPG